MARLATLITHGTNGFFIPLLEHIMVDARDRKKPGLFLELFPHPLSRLFLTLLWKINAEQEGDAVLLSNVWLREFAKLDAKSLRKYRDYLHTSHVIRRKKVGSGREYLYRAVNRKGQPLEANESDADTLTRLRSGEGRKEMIRKRIIQRYTRRAAPTAEPEPLLATPSSWDTEGDF